MRPATVFASKTSRGVKTRPADFARETSWIDMIESPPRPKKESSTPILPPTQHLREEVREDRFGSGGRRPRRLGCSRDGEVRSREAASVELSVDRQWKRFEDDDRGGHHVLREFGGDEVGHRR